MPMTPDERNLLLLLAKMVLSHGRTISEHSQLRAAIARIETAESGPRDQFVDKIMKGST